MPKSNKPTGRRVNIWLSGESLRVWNMLDNGSGFVRIALEDAVGIMTWAILKKQDPEKYHTKEVPIEDVLGTFNQEFPLNELTSKRLGKDATWPVNSQKKPELW